MRTAAPRTTLDRLEPTLLRWALAVVFVWFGLPKLTPGLSPAEEFVRTAIPCCDPSWFVPTLGAAETLIGICLVVPRWLPVGLVLLAGHLIGTAVPLVSVPHVTWKAFPVATLEGQYVLKNIVLVAAALVVAGAHLRRARVHPHGSEQGCDASRRRALS